jgi:uncharacterized protein (DUF433 family)
VLHLHATIEYAEVGTLEDGMTAKETTIQKTSGVIGGDACIRNTRIAVWMLVESRRLGISDEQLLHDYPLLTRDDLNAAWAYFAAHSDEIETAIRENNEAE